MNAVRLDRWVVLSIFLVWLAALFLLELFSVINDSGVRVRFASGPAFLDFGLYSSFNFDRISALWRPFEFTRIFWVEGIAAALSWLKLMPIVPGPVYPALIHLFGFQENPASLSGVYIALGAVLGVSWASWAKTRSPLWLVQVVLGAFPFLIYYSVLVSADLLFAIWVWIFFLLISRCDSSDRAPFHLFSLVIILAILTRPTGLIFVGIAGLALALKLPVQTLKTASGRFFVVFLIFASLWGLVYYAPYFLVHDANGAKTHYFGLLPDAYKAGLFSALPDFIDTVFSYTLLFGAKVLHAVGLRPSYAAIDPVFTLARSLPGIFFLPGLLLVIVRGSALERVFIVCFMLPVFVAASQERYILGIMPILFYWGWVFWASTFKSFGGSLRSAVFR
jgi:hypothetical protein